jgi:hypothetical protein
VQLAELIEEVYIESQRSPSFALKVGHELRKCAELVRNSALKERNTTVLHNAEAFLEIRKYAWPKRGSGHALSALNSQKRNKVELLPCTSDLMKMTSYLESQRAVLTLSLEESCGNNEI